MATAVQQEVEASERRPSRRRRYIINRAFQARFVLTLTLTVFLITSIMSSVLYGLLHHQARMRLMNPRTYVAEVPMVVIGSGLAFSLVAAVAVGFWCFVLSHRICGPLMVMDGFMAGLAAGRFPELRPLRKRDEFKDFYANFSKTVDSLKEIKRADFRALDEMLATARSGLAAEGQARDQALESLAAQIEDLRAKSAEALDAG